MQVPPLAHYLTASLNPKLSLLVFDYPRILSFHRQKPLLTSPVISLLTCGIARAAALDDLLDGYGSVGDQVASIADQGR
jgi:hypothetical protein